jgi:hypothetical protein
MLVVVLQLLVHFPIIDLDKITYEDAISINGKLVVAVLKVNRSGPMMNGGTYACPDHEKENIRIARLNGRNPGLKGKQLIVVGRVNARNICTIWGDNTPLEYLNMIEIDAHGNGFKSLFDLSLSSVRISNFEFLSLFLNSN